MYTFRELLVKQFKLIDVPFPDCSECQINDRIVKNYAMFKLRCNRRRKLSDVLNERSLAVSLCQMLINNYYSVN